MEKTALVLSGGGSRGAYQIGVWKALRHLGIDFHMVIGTSVGAINGAMILQNEPELAEKLWHQLETDVVFDVKTVGIPSEDALTYAREIVLHGGAGTRGLQGLLHQYLDEARIRKSSVEYGLVTTEFPSMEGRYLYKEDIPSGKLPDYILASASCFPAVQKYTIDGIKYIDGGYRDNLPVKMALEKGATNIIAVDVHAAGIVHKQPLEEARRQCKEFHFIESHLDLGNFLIFDQINTQRIMDLGYLETLRHWGKYDGEKYTFKKGEFNAHHLAGADNCAYFLHLDPCRVYDRESLLSAARQRIAALQPAEQKHNEEPKHNIIWTSLLESSDDDASPDCHSDALSIRSHLMLYIAKSLQEDREKSPFLQPAVFKLLTEEIQAANFLINNGVLG